MKLNKKEIQELKKKFLVNTDETGRFLVKSPRTGITYFIEPILGGVRKRWGNVLLGADSIDSGYGDKYTGAVPKNQSLITEENGFENIQILDPGISPHGEIERVDAIRYEQGYRPK